MRRTRIVGAAVLLGALSLAPAAPDDAHTEVRAAADVFLEISGIKGETRSP